MSWKLYLALAAFAMPVTQALSAQSAPTTDVPLSSDRLVDVGGYSLHFRVIGGKGVPILFESGGGDGADVWKSILPAIAAKTGAPLITYDRAGFGQSGFSRDEHGLIAASKALEVGLAKLGYKGPVVLVAHSLGGFNAAEFAFRNPRRIKAAILIEANLPCFFTDQHMDDNRAENQADMARFAAEKKWGLFYLVADLEGSVRLLRTHPFPTSIPVTDIVAEKTHFPDEAKFQRWKACHADFVAAAPNRRAVLAQGSGHYVYREKPEIVIKEIVDSYSRYARR